MDDNTKYIINLYKKENSINQIAKELNTYPNKIRRILLKNNIKLRNISEAQTLALKHGTAIHPTKGKERSNESKFRISEGNSKAWKSLTEQELEKRKETFRNKWKERPESVILDMRAKSGKAIAEAGKHGSKIERLVVEGLKDAGYGVVHHVKGAINTSKLEPDIVIPAMNVVIEIDGPGHFKPIWGEEKLQKRIVSDMEKNGHFLREGYCVIRVIYNSKTLSEKRKRDIITGIINLLEKIRIKHENKIIEVEF